MSSSNWGNQQWQYLNPKTNGFENIVLPCNPDFPDGIAIFRLTYDATNVSSPAIFISTLGVPFEIKTDSRVDYHFGDFSQDSFLGFPSHLLPLKETSGTLDFKVLVTPYSKGICREIVIGDKDAIYHKVVSDNIKIVVSSSFFVTVSFVAIGLYFFLKRQPIFLYLFLFIFSATTWQFSNNSNPLKDIILPSPILWGYLDIFSLCLIPVAFLGLCIRLVGDKWYVLRTAFILHLLFWISAIGGAIAGWNVAHAIKLFNVLLVCSAVVSFVYLMLQAYVLKKRFLFIGVVSVLLVVAHDVLLWMNILMWQSHLAPLGVLAFVLFLGAEAVNNGYRIARDAIDAQARMTAVREIMHNIAHDIRRPFSMAWQVLATAGHVSHLEKIDEAMRSVDGILNDIMDVDARIELNCESVPLVSLIMEAMAGIYSAFAEEKIAVKWNFSSDITLRIDKHKMLRVIENIIQNAVEATAGKEREIAFSVDLVSNKHRLMIGIQNSKSFVSPAIREKIFQPYFSYGKQRGKGIGLAICRRFVDAHGGNIRCYSSDIGDSWTRFEISLPRDRAEASNLLLPEALPSEWSSVDQFWFGKQRDNVQRPLEELRDELRLHIVQSSGVAEICIIDDEFVFAESAKIIVEALLLGRVKCSVISVDEHLMCVLRKRRFDGYIVDYDLGLPEVDGIAVIKGLIEKHGRFSPIMMMTNRTIPALAKETEDLKILLEAKPATEEKFLKFALELFPSSKALRPRVVVVDDETYVLDAWQRIMTDAVVTVFDNPYSFYDNIIDNPLELANTSCIILDYFFKGTDVEKENLVRAARRKGFMRPIILSSNRNIDLSLLEECDRFDASLPKRALSFADLVKNPDVACAFRRYAKKIELN